MSKRQVSPYRLRVWGYLDTLDNPEDTTVRQIAAAVDCSVGTAVRYCREWYEQAEPPQPDRGRCSACGFAGWDHSPILSDGRCLLCHLDEQGINPLMLAESGVLRTLCEEIGK